MKLLSFDDYLDEQLQDKEFKEYFDKYVLIMEIAQNVAKLRKANKMSQQQLAKKIGTTQSAIARLESGKDKRMPSITLLAKIAAASDAHLKISIETDPHAEA